MFDQDFSTDYFSNDSLSELFSEDFEPSVDDRTPSEKFFDHCGENARNFTLADFISMCDVLIAYLESDQESLCAYDWVWSDWLQLSEQYGDRRNCVSQYGLELLDGADREYVRVIYEEFASYLMYFVV